MRLFKDASLGEDSVLWCTLLSSKLTQVHLQHQKWTPEKLLLTVQLSSGKVVCLCEHSSMMLWYASAIFSQVTYYVFVSILWHEAGMKWEIKAGAERQQYLFSYLPHYILTELSLILICICYPGITFIHVFFPLFTLIWFSFSGSYFALLFLCAQFHCSYIYERF